MSTDDNVPNKKTTKEIVEEIKGSYVNLNSTTTIVSRYLGSPAKRTGRRPIWMCPFHNDKNPSFSVNPKNGACGCFGCGAYFSNGIDFVMEYENLTLAESAIITADILGVETFANVSTIKRGEHSIQKKELTKELEIETKSITTKQLNFVYSMFIDVAKKKYGISSKHSNELKDVRLYNDDIIEEFKFFSFPKASIIKEVIESLQSNGIENINAALAYVPGFFYDKKNGQWEHMLLAKGVEGYAFPLVNASGEIVAIQIRLTSGAKPGMKYTWFQSAFARNPKEGHEPKILGASPGAPLSMILPDSGKAKRLLITEGFHKAIVAAKYLEFEKYAAITAQGVNNTKGVVSFARDVSKIAGCGFLDIAFDGDMAIKETVLKPAIKLGIRLCGLPFPVDMLKNITNILSQGNKNSEEIASCYEKEANEISEYLHDKASNMWFAEINFLSWFEEEKGLDDLFHAGKESSIERFSLADFWDISYEFLSNIEKLKLEKTIETNEKFSRIDLDKKLVESMFYDALHKKLAKLHKTA